MKRFLAVILLLAGAFGRLDAKVELPPVFADNMVLQRESEAAIWGKAVKG